MIMLLLFYNVTLVDLLTYDYAPIYYRSTYVSVNREDKAINN